MKRSRRLVSGGWAHSFPHRTQSPSPAPQPRNLGKSRPPLPGGIGNRGPCMAVPGRHTQGGGKSQTAATVTKITARNVNKIVLQAAHSPPHTQLPLSEQKVTTYKVCFQDMWSGSLGRSHADEVFFLHVAPLHTHTAWGGLLKAHWACPLI